MRKLLITGVLAIVIGVAAAVFSTSLYSTASDAMTLSEKNTGIAKEALRTAEGLSESDPAHAEQLAKAQQYVAYAEGNLDWHNETVDQAVLFTVVSVFTVLGGAILLVIRRRRTAES
ncbi:hypothetical protein [Lentzea sp. NPDC003310]|uniref:hypothetical protein n=1 Tax=Lentzea sp. NPDC003310 TaxID=3154447 RepID=UPI0033B03E2A